MNDKSQRNKEIFELYNKKLYKIKELAEKYNISHKQIRAIFNKNGIYIWEDEPDKELLEYLRKYKKKEVTREEICHALKKSRSAIDNKIRRLGIKIWDAKFHLEQRTFKPKRSSKFYSYEEFFKNTIFYRFNE